MQFMAETSRLDTLGSHSHLYRISSVHIFPFPLPEVSWALFMRYLMVFDTSLKIAHGKCEHCIFQLGIKYCICICVLVLVDKRVFLQNGLRIWRFHSKEKDCVNYRHHWPSMLTKKFIYYAYNLILRANFSCLPAMPGSLLEGRREY